LLTQTDVIDALHAHRPIDTTEATLVELKEIVADAHRTIKPPLRKYALSVRSDMARSRRERLARLATST
jgi:hypothetical protein